MGEDSLASTPTFSSFHSGGGGGSGGSKMRLLPLFICLLLASAAVILGYMVYVSFTGVGSGPTDYFQTNPITHHPQFYRRSKYTLPRPPLIGEGDQSYDNLNRPRGGSDPNDPDNDQTGLPGNLLRVNQDVGRDPDLDRKVELIKMRAISKLRRSILNGAKVKGHLNEYGVDFSKLKPKSQHVTAKAVLCRLKKAGIHLIAQNSVGSFADKVFPTEPLFGNREGDAFSDTVEAQPLYKTCAVIPNSAAFDGARHGIDIDSHDFIIRFNNAPTAGYESDVGSLTSLRIVNSQVVTKPQFHFPRRQRSSPSNRVKGQPINVTSKGGTASDDRTTRAELAAMDVDAVWEATPKFLVWDPCMYSASLEEWVRKPDFPLFEKYFNLTRAERNRFYLLDCRLIWRFWEILQEYSFVKIYGNPPTSGFIGIMLGLQVCERVDVYEYIPSVRESARCHYYGPRNESNPSCTYGAWHPVSAEKLFFLSLSDGTDKGVFIDGVLTLPGVSTIKDC